ncbi:glucose-6-phosphate 1-dehydrogenase [Pirellula staleyi DSM 6068]|uniref:Glucose-6-phosphate 1-dehydrogenase n=1 Tax=Pirellula staleyi (strain ATCC 27377 / DSM 6068 / ICPB 4128) TaxID=530564 RepID=D2R4U1_PIRSD|nr:glucose-6-phosphate dehydrogenase [Pirellula staleyi]ADB17157.1 glucose-6-phosphate 1-dehydrogenase [Pirellula staleyi DSM 6068]
MPHQVVIFGASGDLTSRKLIPALYLLSRKNRLPKETKVIGVSRTDFSHEAWRNELLATTKKFAGSEFDEASWNTFAANVFYHAADAAESDGIQSLDRFLKELEAGQTSTRLYYLSTSPKLYEQIIAQLGAAGMAEESQGTRRIVIEKPFGTDLSSAKRLNLSTHKVFDEKQVYRIDHYLGKETVQNLLVLRFANTIFEPIWNRNYIDHVQITVAEEVDVGRRAGCYDGSGVLRDMFQNHLLQLLMITAMEAPSRFQADFVRDEKVKVLRAVRPLNGSDYARDTVRGQYDGYLQAEGVPQGSQTATFAALKLQVDNWRWSGVPFYLRSGKAMSCRTTQIVIQFRQPPHMLFADGARPATQCDANRLVVQIQPAEGIQLEFQTKVPDAGMRLRMTDLDFSFQREFTGVMPDSYQRLLLDALNGDASLFARSDEVELAWGIIDPILAAWQSDDAPPLDGYPKGDWGPDRSDKWMHEQGRQWFDVCPVLH